jgi:hypothetical protein
MRAALALSMVAAFAACEPAATPTVETVSFRLQGTPADANVTIDDLQLGSVEYVAARGVALPKGVHHLTIEAPGYFPFDQELDAEITTPPRPIVVVVKLEPIPD